VREILRDTRENIPQCFVRVSIAVPLAPFRPFWPPCSSPPFGGICWNASVSPISRAPTSLRVQPGPHSVTLFFPPLKGFKILTTPKLCPTPFWTPPFKNPAQSILIPNKDEGPSYEKSIPQFIP